MKIEKCVKEAFVVIGKEGSTNEGGDLAFYADLSHVGIVVGKDINGNFLVIHCAGGYNKVVLTANSGFALCARPNGY